MEILELNETPIKTSKSFNINNIKLDNIVIPENIDDFKNLNIINNTEKIEIENDVQNPNYNLTYGLGNLLTNQIKEKSNKKLKIVVNNIKSKNINDEIQLEFCFDNKNLNLLENIEIIVNEDSKASFIIKYKSVDNFDFFHNGMIKVFAKENSKINITIVNLLNNNSNNFIAIENEIEKNADVKYTIIDFGGKTSLTNYYSNIIGEKGNNILNTIYLGKDIQTFDLNYIAELRGEKTNIDIDVIGALKENAKKHFKGTIDFKKGAKKATGNESEYCMLLSDNARSIALPMLLCSEEDVVGNHSSAAGKVEEKELFYIMSRGFNKKDALKLLVRAKFNKIIDKIENDELKEEILEEIDKKLN